MKIGYLCSDIDIFLFGHEGCSIHIREFTNALVEAGHDVFILCSSLGENTGATTKARVYHLEPRGLDALAWSLIEEEPVIQNHHLERDLRSVLYNSWLEGEGSSILEQEKPDLLYERYSLFGWAGIELSRRHGVPLLLEVNAPLCREQQGYEKFTLTGMAERMEREVLREADAVITVSQWLKGWVVSWGVAEKKVHVIPNGVSDRIFGTEVSGEDIRDHYNLKGKQIIGHVGSFQPWHDVYGLLKAFCRLYRNDSRLRLLLVGDGPQRSSLENMVDQLGVASAVVFTGNVAHEKVPHFIRAMDVAVIPYGKKPDFYFSPLKLFECMAAGKPTVAAALGQIEEIVDHRKTGWLYPPGEHEKLDEGLATLLYDPELASTMGKAARRQIMSEHTWKAIAMRVTELAWRLQARSV